MVIDWKEYLSIVVKTFRSYYKELGAEEKAATQLNTTFVEPCQIEFFSFENDGQMMLVTLLPDFSDEIVIHEHLGKDFDFRSVFEKRLLGINIRRIFKHYVEDGKVSEGIIWSSLGENASLYLFSEGIQNVYSDPEVFGKSVFENVSRASRETIKSRRRSTEFSRIEEQLKKLQLDAEKILDESLRRNVLQHTSKIDDSISNVKKLEQHEQRLSTVEQEIGGVRKLIGTTKEFQDFRVFSTDIENLKKSHVPKEVFDSEVKRLDQRIDSLREVKFWSRRAIVDIVLAIIATASTIIAALLAAGVLKF